jgi:hypothetical protein
VSRREQARPDVTRTGVREPVLQQLLAMLDDTGRDLDWWQRIWEVIRQSLRN